MQLTSGTLLERGKYRIISTLGRGGFGVTYLAEQVLAKRKVCIKEFFPKDYYKRDEDSVSISLLSENFTENMSRFKEKFVKEAQTIAALDHPNIIPIYDVFEENNTAYYVMEYIDGESLNEKVKGAGAIIEEMATFYIRQVASALEHIHEKQIMHLDVKPGNIMIRTKDNRAILIDFGLSKHYDECSGEATSTTPVGVSHGFAPLEQYKQGGIKSFSPETDIYSLGATLYYLIMGTIPPQAADVADDGLPGLPAHISEGVRAAIMHAMGDKRKDRPHSIAEFLEIMDGKVVKPLAAINCTEIIPEATEIPNNISTHDAQTVELQHDTVLNVKPQHQQTPKPPKRKRSRWWLWMIITAIVTGVATFIILNMGKATHDDNAEQIHQDSIPREQPKQDSTTNNQPEIKQDTIKQSEQKPEKPDGGSNNNDQAKKDAEARARASLRLTSKSTEISCESNKHELSFTLLSPYPGMKVTAVPNNECADWIIIDDVSSKMVYYTATENVTTSERKGAIIVKYNNKSYTYTITQRNRDKRGLWNKGEELYNQGRHEEAVKYYRLAADRGYDKAQNSLGYCFYKGHGVEENHDEAAKWIRKAAEQGNVNAQYNLGCLYKEGQGVEKNTKLAKEWIMKAAAKDHHGAIIALQNWED